MPRDAPFTPLITASVYYYKKKRKEKNGSEGDIYVTNRCSREKREINGTGFPDARDTLWTYQLFYYQAQNTIPQYGEQTLRFLKRRNIFL